MNDTLHQLHGIELAPVASNSSLLIVLITIATLLSITGLIWYWKKQNQPLKKAIRHLKAIADKPLNPSIITAHLLQGLCVKQLKNSNLPSDFIKQLEHAQFSSSPCSPEEYYSLKQKAIRLLQDIQEEHIK